MRSTKSLTCWNSDADRLPEESRTKPTSMILSQASISEKEIYCTVTFKCLPFVKNS